MIWQYYGETPGPISLGDLNSILHHLGFEIYDAGRCSVLGEKGFYLDIRPLSKQGGDGDELK